MDSNIIFYSNKCKFCKKIIDLITEENLIESYKLICIDNNSKNYPYIQRVPTLLISKDKKPLVGVNAFNYLQANSQFNKNTNNINLNPNKNIDKELNPLLYNNDDLNNIDYKKNFSFIDEKNDESLIEQFKPKDDKLFLLPEMEKINLKDQKSKLNNLMKLRNKQDFGLNNFDTKMSNETNLLTSNNLSKNNDLNTKYNEINFSVLEGRKVNVTPDVDFLGSLTSKIKVSKK